MPFEVSVSQKDQTLPMILTLRGDENIIEEFTFDTDQAMAYLGIKRSRLNQISGRELRVARVRRDRYIRPVYRECDLKDYLDWTRATATHLSSSKAIEQAVENLDDRFNDVLQVLNDKLQQLSVEQKFWMKGEFERLPTKFQSLTQPQEESNPDLPWQRHDKLLRNQNERLLELNAELKAVHMRLREMQGLLGELVPEMKELNVAQKSLRLDFDRHFGTLVTKLLQFEDERRGDGRNAEEFFADAREFFNSKGEEIQADLIPVGEGKEPKARLGRRHRPVINRIMRRYAAR